MMESEGKMTTTDARGWITALIKAMHEETSGSWPDPEYKDEVYSALEMAIQALENHDTFMKYAYSQGKQDALSQEPCEDAISRDEALICLTGKFEPDKKYEPEKLIELFSKRIKQLPSVTQKSGKWIITHLSNMAYCSECDYLFKDVPASIVEHFKHCPYCGAKMESEGKE